MNINKDRFNSLFEEASKEEVIGFNCDFASAGERSAQSHSKHIYSLLQEIIYNTEAPFLVVGKRAIMYLVQHDFLSILYGKITKLTKMGSIIKGEKNYPVIKEIRNCKGCGSPLYNSICEYCGSFKDGVVFETVLGSLDVYAIPENWNSAFSNCILCLSGDISNNSVQIGGLIELYNIY